MENPNRPPQKPPTEKELRKLEEDMNKRYTLVFTKRELLILFNVLNTPDYKLGDAKAILPVADKIQAIIAVDSNMKAN